MIQTSLFNPLEIALSLKEVAVDIIQTENHRVVSRWFHSTKDADLFIWLDESTRIIKQQLTFCGQVVEWNAVEGLRTGFVYEDDTHAKYEGSEVIHFDNQLIKASVSQAIEILEGMTQLDPVERQTLIDNLTAPAWSRTFSYGEFYTRFTRPKKGRQTYFFFANLRRRLKKLFS